MNWTHRICDNCWYKSYKKDPVRLKNDPIGKCCFCSKDTASGIYVRYDPKELNCQDNHKDDEV